MLGWLDGADETEGPWLGCELGAPVTLGLVLGWLDGAAETEGLSEGMDVGSWLVDGLALGPPAG